ncbi:hypothetical protein Mapa_002994 [Marchantia paleacea]|nr:hypothetical protein Mapa_002994 [Marchantia paleacea]
MQHRLPSPVTSCAATAAISLPTFFCCSCCYSSSSSSRGSCRIQPNILLLQREITITVTPESTHNTPTTLPTFDKSPARVTVIATLAAECPPTTSCERESRQRVATQHLYPHLIL